LQVEQLPTVAADSERFLVTAKAPGQSGAWGVKTRLDEPELIYTSAADSAVLFRAKRQKDMPDRPDEPARPTRQIYE
jgi:hypothetical protein